MVDFFDLFVPNVAAVERVRGFFVENASEGVAKTAD